MNNIDEFVSVLFELQGNDIITSEDVSELLWKEVKEEADDDDKGMAK